MSDLLVFDFHQDPYDETTLLHRPLGGSQSAVVETCVALAHDMDVTLCNTTPEERRSGRLRFVPIRRVPLSLFLSAQWVVFVGCIQPENLERLPFRHGRPRIALWAHHDVDQPAVATLDRPALLRQIARLLFASQWQRDRYCRRFGVARELTAVVGNPYCERAYELATRREKRYERPEFVYTSTPFRGLDVLAAAFPRVLERLPGARLTVLSGLELYGSGDDAPYRSLYDRLAGMAGVEFLKPCGKVELYARLAEANVLSYPSTFAETFCVNALEAALMQNALFLTPTGALPELFPDADFACVPSGSPSPDEWAEFMVRAWHSVPARAARGDFAATADKYRRDFAPAAAAARLRQALFG